MMPNNRKIELVGNEDLQHTLRFILKRGKKENVYDLTVILVTLDPKCIESKKELNRAIEFIESDGINTIKRIIREKDELFTLNNTTILIWLKHTHEAGADFVANRIKRTLTTISKDKLGHELYFLVGTYSESTALDVSVEEISRMLASDLKMEENCQTFFLNRLKLECGTKLGPVFSMGLKEGSKDLIKKELNRFGYELETISRQEDLIKNFGEFSHNSVLIMGEEMSGDEIELTVKKIRQNRMLDCIFLLIYNDTKEDIEDLINGAILRPEKDSSGLELIKHILIGYQMSLLKTITKMQATYHSLLESIRATSHKLNQPLQIIMGKAELASYGLIDEKDLSKVFSEIKKNVLLVSDINTKIARIASGQN